MGAAVSEDLAAEIDLFIPLKYLIQCYELQLSHFAVFFFYSWHHYSVND